MLGQPGEKVGWRPPDNATFFLGAPQNAGSPSNRSGTAGGYIE